LPDVLVLLRDLLPEAVFVTGGPEASHNPDYWLEYADFVICGEGERGFPALLDALEDCGGLDNIAGLCRKQDGIILKNPPPAPLDEFIDPYDGAYPDNLGGRIAYIETSRGCPFSCAFCLSGGSGVRFFPIDAAKSQIERLSQSNTQTIKFVDRTFNCNPGRAYELLEFVIGLETSCRFHFEVAADLFDTRTLSLLNATPHGKIQLEAGLQSFHEPALEASSRQTDLIKAEKNIAAILRGGNIHVHVDLIAGLPHETLTDFIAGFNRAYNLKAHTLQLGFLKMLHGSKIRSGQTDIAYNYLPPYEIASSPWMSEGDLHILKQTENALQHTHNKSRFLSAIAYVLDASGQNPFAFYHGLGAYAPNHGTPLEDYARQFFDYSTTLTGVDDAVLREQMICDWLGMTKGANMPPFLKLKGRRDALDTAQKLTGRRPGRHEAAMLPSGRTAFAQSKDRDAVTGLYRVVIV